MGEHCKTVQTRLFFHRGISVWVIYVYVNVLFIHPNPKATLLCHKKNKKITVVSVTTLSTMHILIPRKLGLGSEKGN